MLPDANTRGINKLEVGYITLVRKTYPRSARVSWFSQVRVTPLKLTERGDIMVPCHGNGSACITGPLWGESTSHWWIPHTKGQWCRSLIFSLLSAWTNWIGSDLRCHDIHAVWLWWVKPKYIQLITLPEPTFLPTVVSLWLTVLIVSGCQKNHSSSSSSDLDLRSNYNEPPNCHVFL